MKRLFPWIIPFILAGIFIFSALYSPLPLATNSDFRVLYYTDKALIQDINVYDHPSKVNLVAGEEGVPAEAVAAFPQFAYPPWFALTTFYLGFLSIKSAATLWFEINLTMLLLSVWLFTDEWLPVKRLISFPAVFIFIPVLGVLVIGQYDFPILLGVALLNYAIKKEKPGFTALGMSLLTFKPHLGGLLILACLLHLAFRRDTFGWQALKMIFLTGAIMFAGGFLGDSAWPVNYLNSLLGYRNLSHITSCSECANISTWLTRWLTGALSLSIATAISAALMIALLIVLTVIRPPLWKSPDLLLNAITLTTLFASPYLYNYDFILLLFPIFWLAGHKLKPIESFFLGVACILPALALGIFGRNGNVFFVIVLFILAVLIFQLARRSAIPSSQYIRGSNAHTDSAGG